jgi:sucrose-6F-phosphate phosphohydrolase
VGSRLLVTDIDGTLVGDDAALGRFADWYGRHRAGVTLVYATGRTRESVARLVGATAAPQPDVVISLVGTEIHDRDGRPWPGWFERFEGWDADHVRRELGGDDRLELQPVALQSRLKASYFAPAMSDADLQALAAGLSRAGLDGTIVYSFDLFLDVLPVGAGKGPATRAVAETLGVSPSDVLTFGDSGNDLGLFEPGFRGTVVGNASPELRRAVDGRAYVSSLPFADGILDGIRHWTADAGDATGASGATQVGGAIGASTAKPLPGA